jgi:membrane protein implicated in regulation of membrane protease activity
VAARHSPLFLLFMALAACCVGAAGLVTLAAWPRTWPLVAVLLVVALVDVWIAWRKGAI